jgi:hypothetical protein
MNRSILAAASCCAATFGLFHAPCSVAAEDETLTMFNKTDRNITVLVASDKRNDAGRWVSRSIPNGGRASITLRSPDNYLVEVRIGRDRFVSEPVPLKAQIAANPRYEFVIGQTFGGAPGAPADQVFGLSARQQPPNDDDSVDAPFSFSLQRPGSRDSD